MRIRIENVAKINDADINIDGITVIAGSNNTGKSTVGKALFALFEAFYNLDEYVQEWKPRDARLILRKYGSNLDIICKRLSGLKRRKVSSTDELQGQYAYFFADCKSENAIADCMDRYCMEHLQLYGVGDQFHNDEIQYWLAGARTDMIETMMDYDSEYAKKHGIQRAFQSVFGRQVCKRTKKAEGKIEARRAVTEIEISSRESQGYKMRNAVVLENDEVKAVHQEFAVDTKALYIENPRILDQFSRLGYERSEGSAQKKIERWLRPNQGNEYYRVVPNAYGLNRWIDSEVSDNVENTESNVEMQRMDAIIDKIDKQLVELMGGTVDFEKTNSPLDFQDDDYVEPFNLSNLSTGLKAISLLQCVLHYRVLKPKSVLILDEPEINLHPEWQVKYADYIASLQASLHLHIVVTTHSPFFLKAIENAAIKNGIENHCHYYYTDIENGDAVLRCVDDSVESVYRKMMMPLFDMIEDMGL